jgi:hypothetical protein
MPRGGSRNGAGRPAHRLKAEVCFALDVNYLARNDYLDEGNWNRLYWRQYGQTQLNALIISRGYCIDISIESFKQTIVLTETPCHLGGVRRWLVCPTCFRPMGVLYLRSRRFACRKCQRIAYQSQSGNAQDRMVWKYHTLHDKVCNWKLKRSARFNRMFAKYEEVAWQFDELIDQAFQKISLLDKWQR